MTLHRRLVLGLATLWAAHARAEDHTRNTWALGVEHRDDSGRITAWSAAGPLVFSKAAPEGATVSGVRPFWVQTKDDATGSLRSATALYPLFSYQADASRYSWSFFELIKRSGRKATAPAPRSPFEENEAFEVWPFWFSRHPHDPVDGYQALFPLYGTIKGRLGYQRLSWTLFPFYFQSQKKGATTTQTPWPFIRVTRGTEHGFAFWPLFGWEERPGVSRDEFYLWPLIYNSTRQPAADAPAGTVPTHQFGALPFYACSTGPGVVDENYLWPFFGFTARTAPWKYHETRYFWPFLVQGRGDDRFVDRWGPFYTHSIIKGTDKTWIGWPLYCQTRWTDQGVAQTKTQILWRIYWSLEQRSLTNPSAAPASIRHVWPLFSTWDNGAGRRQTLALSPFEVFFPGNAKMRESWSPLFAVYRYDQSSPGNERHSLLWDLVRWENRAAAPRPTAHSAAPGALAEERVCLGRGLIGARRPAGERAWRLFWLDFPSKPASISTASVR